MSLDNKFKAFLTEDEDGPIFSGTARSGPVGGGYAPVSLDDPGHGPAIFYLNSDESLRRINAYLHQMSLRSYFNPYYAIQELQMKLMSIGITFEKPLLVGESGVIDVPVYRWGGREGTDGSGLGITSDDGTGVPGGLVLRFAYNTTQGMCNLDVQILHVNNPVNSQLQETDTPVKFNVAGTLSLPLSVTAAKTRTAQIDALYQIADDPATPRDQSEQLLRLIKKINK